MSPSTTLSSGLSKSSVQVSLPNVSTAEGASGVDAVALLEGGKDAEATSTYTCKKCSGTNWNKNRLL